jgi:hypothetical protein
MPLHLKRTRERHCLKLFQQAFADFPAGHVLEWATPDFLIRSASGRVGIEVAEVLISDAIPGPNGTPDQLQKIFDQNNPAYRICRTNCDQAWLLLVMLADGVANWSDKAYSHAYETAFDRAFLLENGHKVTELQAH